MRILYSNVDGLISKKLELTDLLKSKKPEIVCLTETKLKDILDINLLGWSEYNIWRRDRKGKQGGGVCILTSNKLKVTEINLVTERAEVIAVEVTTNDTGNEKIVVAVAYVPPKTKSWSKENHKLMRNETLSVIESILRLNMDIFLCGDFNCKEVNWEEMETGAGEGNWGYDVLNMAMDNLLYQHVDQATRSRGGDTPSRLDLFFSRKIEDVQDIQYLTPFGKSDHDVLDIQLLLKYKLTIEEEKYKEGRWNFAKANFREINKYFRDQGWENVLAEDNVNKKLEAFMEVYTDGINKFVPTFKENNKLVKHRAWFNYECTKAKEMKDKAWKKMRKWDTEENSRQYKDARNKYTEVRRRTEAHYEKKTLENYERNPKMFFKYVNGKRKIKDTIQKIRIGNRISEDIAEITEELNRNFASVFTREETFTPPAVSVANLDTMPDLVFTREQLIEKMRRVDPNKSVGPDGVSGWILKENAEELSTPILNIMNTSLETGIVPSEWKKATIVPIFKGGNREKPLNYRPVSLLSILMKILESFVRDKWVEYLEKENIITDQQFGFREGRSCVSNLLSFYSRVVDVVDQREGWVDCVYLDFKKAFDKVPHDRLLWKLKDIGRVGDKLYKWMENYLRERKMQTMVRGKSSSWTEVASGVPQGSVLAPVLFLIFVNDLPEGLSSYVNMFADDAKLMKRVKKQEDCWALQDDLKNIHKWSTKWNMEFNAEKCKVLEIGKSQYRPRHDYKLGNVELLKADKEKDLGIIIQNNMSPESHVNKLVRESLSLLANIRMTFNYLDENIMKKLITAIIRPRVEYAAVAWSPHMRKHIDKIERIQRAATKMIPGMEDMEYQERLNALNLPTLEQRRKRGQQIQLYKCVRGMEKIDLESFIERDRGERTRGHIYKLKLPTSKTDLKSKRFPSNAIIKWNNLPAEVVSAPSVNSFKARYDKFMSGGGN